MWQYRRPFVRIPAPKPLWEVAPVASEFREPWQHHEAIPGRTDAPSELRWGGDLVAHVTGGHDGKPWLLLSNPLLPLTEQDDIVRRAAAAVNACRGIPTPALEEDLVTGLRRVVRELGAALDLMFAIHGQHCPEFQPSHCPMAWRAFMAGQAVLAKAEGRLP